MTPGMRQAEEKIVSDIETPDGASPATSTAEAWRADLSNLLRTAGVDPQLIDAADAVFEQALAEDPVHELGVEELFRYASHFSEINDGYGLAWINATGTNETFTGSSLVEIVLAYVNRADGLRLTPLAGHVADMLFDSGVQDETFEQACEILDRVKRVWVMSAPPPLSITDGKINEITREKLGQWPSYEAQSWACKVVHALLDSRAQRVEAEEKKTDD